MSAAPDTQAALAAALAENPEASERHEALLGWIRQHRKAAKIKVTRPVSEFPELHVTVPDSWDSIQLAPLYDVHMGHAQHDAEMFARHLRWIRETQNVLTWNGGDLIENASKFSVGAGVYEQDLTPQSQLIRSLYRLTPIVHKMLFAIPGNHEARTNEAGLSIASWMAMCLEVPYFPDFCLAPQTRILTHDLQWMAIGDASVGQKIVAFDEQPTGPNRGRRWRVATVESKTFLRRPCYRVILEDGTEFVSSSEHRWLTARGGSHFLWTRTDRLLQDYNGRARQDHHLLRVVDAWKDPQSLTKSWEIGYLAGAFDSEGHIQQTTKPYNESYANGVVFSQRPNVVLDTVRACLRSLDFRWREHQRADGLIAVEMSGVAEMLRLLGQVRPERLRSRFDISKLGRLSCRADTGRVRVVALEPLGERDVVALKTSTGTFVAEGFASHNCMLTIHWRKNHFRILAHHGSGAAQTAGAQRMAARKDIAWARNFDLIWTGHLHAPLVDVLYQVEVDQATGLMHERNGMVIISPSYVKYFSTYAAAKRYTPGTRGLAVAVLRPDGRIEANIHANGRRI